MKRRVRISDTEYGEIVKELISETTFLPSVMRVIQCLLETLPDIFKVSRCTFYRLLLVEDRLWCEIVAGVPKDKHGIGRKRQITETEHRDILSAAESLETKVEKFPRTSQRTKHFWQTVADNNINQILYASIAEGDLKGVIVVDATDEKLFFTDGEIKIFKETFLELLHGIRILSLQGIRHEILQPLIAVTGHSRHLLKIIDAATKEGRIQMSKEELEKLKIDLQQVSAETRRIEQSLQVTSG